MSSIRKSIPVSDSLPVFIFFASLLGIVIWSSQFYAANADEGMLLSSAMKVAEGQVMYRDFFEFWTPGSVYVVGWLIKLFGPTIWLTQAIYIVISFLCYLLLYPVLHQAGVGQKTALASSALFAAIGITFVTINHHWFGMVGCLLTLYFVIRFTQSPHQARFLYWSGFMAGLTAIFMQFEGGVAILSSIVIVSLFSNKSTRVNNLMRMIAPMIILATLTCGYFLAKGALSQLIYSVVEFPLTQYRGSNVGLPSPLWIYQSALIPLSMWVLHRHSWLTRPILAICIFAIAIRLAGMSVISYLHSLLFAYLAHSIFLYTAVKLYQQYACTNQKRARLWSGLTNLYERLGFLDTKVFALSVLFGLFMFAYAAVISEGIVVMSTMVFGGERQMTLTPAGKALAVQPIQERMQYIINFIEESTISSDSIYIGPYSSQYYFLLDRPNPLSYSQLTPNYNTPEMFEHAVKELDEARPKYVVWLARESYFPIGKNNTLYHYIYENYSVKEILEPLPDGLAITRDLSIEPPDAIWQRNPSLTGLEIGSN